MNFEGFLFSFFFFTPCSDFAMGEADGTSGQTTSIAERGVKRKGLPIADSRRMLKEWQQD